MNELVSLNQIVSEIKFFENQAVVSYWEIGKRLAQAKEQVGHGDWEIWIDQNLGYTKRTAQRLIKVFEDYPKATTLSHLTFSKALALTSIKDEEERQDFIEKHDVEDMTTRKLQAEIKKYKRSLEETKTELGAAKAGLEEKEKANRKLTDQISQMENQVEVIEKEVIPEDYRDLKNEVDGLLKDNEELKNKLYMERDRKKEAISQLKAEDAKREIIDQVQGFHYRIAGFIKEVGGLLYLTEYIDEVPPSTKKMFLSSIKYLREFSEQLYKNVERNLKEN